MLELAPPTELHLPKPALIRPAEPELIAATTVPGMAPPIGNPAGFPQHVQSAGGWHGSGASTFNVNLPSSQAGDLLIMTVATRQAARVPAVPSGWTSLASFTLLNESYTGEAGARICYRIASGSEGGTVAVSLGGSVRGSWATMCIRRKGTSPPTMSSASNGTANALATFNTLFLAPGSQRDNILWATIVVRARDTTPGGMTNYTQAGTWGYSSSHDPRITLHWRQLRAASEQPPGLNLASSTPALWRTYVLAIRPW